MKNKLHLGSGGKTLIGWHNLDRNAKSSSDNKTKTYCRPWEAPFIKDEEDSSVDFIFNEHFIEHLNEVDGFVMLQEIYRVLKPKGILRICTPSLDKYVESYLKEDFKENDTFRNGTQFLNYAIYGEGWTNGHQVKYLKSLKLTNFETFRSLNFDHRYIYSEKDLKEKLEFIGFSSIKNVKWGLSNYKELIGLEHHKDRREILIEVAK